MEKYIKMREDGSIQFLFDIRKVLEDGIGQYVLLGIPVGQEYNDYNQNLFYIMDGKIRWQVEDLNAIFNYDKRPNLPFEAIRFSEDGDIIGTNFFGLRYLVSHVDGKIIRQLSSVK